MDSKERHEMMTNELANWMGQIPAFLTTYRNQLIGAALVIIGLISWPIMNRWRQQSDSVAKAQVSSMLDSLETSRYLAVRQQQDSQQESSAESFLAAASNLADEAKKAPTEDLAAIALIKRGQALRMDLFYRKEVVADDTAAAQIKQAQEAYQQALDKAKLPVVKAMAQFSLGLCSEESGQLDQAKAFYQKIIDEPTCVGTPLPTAAKGRIDKMADNNTKYVFAEAPKPAAANPVTPLLVEKPQAKEPNTTATAITAPAGQEKK